MDESRVGGYRSAESESDRLSELPDALILVILSMLRMKDVVRTTFLNKRWKDLWTTVPCLDFCNQHQSFISGALAKWNGDKIFKFSIRLWPPFDVLDSWLLLPIEKQVENFYIFLEPDMYEYSAPQPLISCSSITKLSISHCNLEIGENVQWNRLKSLEIVGIDHFSEDDMNRILSGAPLLEELNLLRLKNCDNLDIRSTRLKMLKIDTYAAYVFYFEENSPVFKIWAPNLESLEISGLWHARCLLNVPCLINATLGFENQYYNFLNEPSRYIMREVMFKQAFLSLSHVQKLTLTDWWPLEFLVDEMKKGNCVLFPKLEMLIIEQEKHSDFWSKKSYSLAPNTILPSPSLLQLKTIVITWDVREASILVAIEILLENARALEKMVIRLRKGKAHHEVYILALEKVASMRRASPSVKVFISIV